MPQAQCHGLLILLQGCPNRMPHLSTLHFETNVVKHCCSHFLHLWHQAHSQVSLKKNLVEMEVMMMSSIAFPASTTPSSHFSSSSSSSPHCSLTSARKALLLHHQRRSPFTWSARAVMVRGESRSEGAAVSYAIPPPAHPTYDLLHVIRLALAEDAGDQGDVTCLATMTPDIQAEAQFLAKADGVIAGIALADMVFNEVDPSLKVEWSVRDGDWIQKGQHFGTIRGRAQSILTAERIVLNFMQRMSGIATLTRAMVEAAKPSRILETRKTAPGLRLVDKWAVLIGGGENHRMGLYDMVMVKDNHIAVAGGISQAITAVEKYLKSKNLDIGVEIETRTLEEVQEVLDSVAQGKGRVTRIMLDNMVVPLANGDVDVSMLQRAVNLIDGKFETEASGNVTLNTVSKIGSTCVTFISSGALTHSVKALDISLNVDTELALEVGKRTNRA